MTKLVRSFCILGALVGFIPFRELAAQGVTSAAVVGRVTDDAGQPIPSGSLTLTNTASGVRYLARSADDGRFFFENVQVGAYVLDARALGHQPGGQVNAKTIPLDAISQYQVLIAPFDVRQGGFTGGLINAVTRRGTNQIHGSLFEYHQGNDFVGDGLTGQPFGTFTENQYGGS